MMKNERWKQTFQDMKDVMSLQHRCHRMVWPVIIIYSFVTAAQPFVSLYFSAEILDDVLVADYETAVWHVAWLIGLNFVLGMLGRICWQIVTNWAETINRQIEMKTVDKAYRMEFEELEKQETMDAIGRIRAGQNANGGLDYQLNLIERMLQGTMGCIFSIVFMIQLFTKTSGTDSFYDGIWPVVILLVVYAIGLLLTFWINDSGRKKEYEMRKENEHTNSLFFYFIGYMLDYRNGKDIRTYQMKEMLMSQFNKAFQPFMKFALKSVKMMSKVDAVQAFLMQVTSCAAFLFVCGKVVAGSISIGSVILYAGAINRISENINRITVAWSAFYYQMQYLKEYQHFIDRPNMHYDGTLPIEKRNDMRYELSFENVTFCYPGTDQPVLKNVSFKFEIGRRYALVGRNGAGKTTLIKLLCRLYEPTEGRILLNGIDIGLYDYDEYVQIFSVVFQDFKLFAFPLGENIAGSHLVDARKARKSLEQAGMAERLEMLPEGLDTLLYHNTGDGIDLSGGEAQKVAIARALYKDAPFVILDEPTAALDPLAEAEVYTHFNDLIQNKTAIYISHRMSSCQFCDEILVLNDGQIAEQGDHAALLEQGGLYAELYQAQAVHYQ